MKASLFSSMSRFCAALVAVAACVFFSLMLAAQICVTRPHVAWCMYYAVMVSMAWLVLEYGERNLGRWFSRCEIWLLVLACLAVHYAMVVWLPEFGQVGMSAPGDSRAAFLALKAGRICHMHLRELNWVNYEILLSALGALWSRSLAFGQMLNGVCHAMVLLPVYCVCRKVGGKAVARLTAILVAFSPVVIVYSALLANECLSSMLLFYAAYFFLKAFDDDQSYGRLALSAAMGGMFLGLSNLFKGIGLVFTIAAVICLVLWVMRRVGLERAKRAFMVLGIVICCQFLTQFAGQLSFAALVGNFGLVSGKSDESLVVYELLIGLDVQHDGMFSGELIKKIRRWDEPERERQLRAAVKRDWRKYPRLMLRKFRNIHGSHACPAGAISHFSIMMQDFPRQEGGRYVSPRICLLVDNGTFVLRILLLLGAMGAFFKARKSFSQALPGVFSMLVILGFAAIEQLVEGHGRYKVAVYPFYFMAVPYISAWFEKDNLVTARVCGLVRKLACRMGRARGC